MIAIEKAWEDNLQESKDSQWGSKEDIIENLCPYDYGLNTIPNCNDGEDNEICIKCWNRKIEEDTKENDNKLELTFEKLEKSPIEGITLDRDSEKLLKEALNDGDRLVFVNTDELLFTYEQMPKIIKWLQDVYNYTTGLKNKVEYVDFMTAKEWMEKDIKNKAKYEDFTYYIKDNELLCDDLYDACTLLLEAINSKEWILL